MNRNVLNIAVGVALISTMNSCEKSDSGNNDEKFTIDSPNVLLIIADDMGVEACPGYSEGNVKPVMPNLQSMISNGVTFGNVWSAPVCTPTRSTILTGKYGSKTNILKVDDILSTTETSLFKYIENNSPHDYSSALIGKWHLGGAGLKNALHPGEMGVKHFSGLLSGGVPDYWRWHHTTNGATKISTKYTTTEFTDLAINWIEDQTQPWFLWLAYNAPHTPFHAPDESLHSQGSLSTNQDDIDSNPFKYFLAMMESMDSEMGRLFDSMSSEVLAKTVIIFVGDNGSHPKVIQTPFSRLKSKGSLYQGGINVPMVMSGYGVTRKSATENALINTTDLFSTIAEITGCTQKSEHNSRSFWKGASEDISAHREYIYSEISDGNNHDWTIRDSQYKLIQFANGSQEFYDMINDEYENNDLSNSTNPDVVEAKSRLFQKGKENSGN